MTQNEKKVFKNWMEFMEFSYFGVICFTITVGSCMGGITVMYLFMNHAPSWMIPLAAMAAMTNNVAAIGQVPVRWLIRIFLSCLALLILLIGVSFLY